VEIFDAIGHNFTTILTDEGYPLTIVRMGWCILRRSQKFTIALNALAFLAGCSSDHSPNIYASNAVQQANKVDVGIVVGFREVMISANGTAGAVTGGAAGGVLGTQAGTSSLDQGLGAVAGSAIGALIGSTIEHVTGDTKGWEYIVRKPNGDYLSVTQIEAKPLSIGQKVLVIGGAQARIVADYSVELPSEQPAVATSAERAPLPVKPVAEEKKPASDMPRDEGIVPLTEKPMITDLPPPMPVKSAVEPNELPAAAPYLPIDVGSEPQ
jgi:outer membrane lipoprotein SlyB